MHQGKLGTSASDGTTPPTAADITYTFYYAKKDHAIGSKTAEVATADELYAALKTLADDGGDNTVGKGKVALTTTNGIGTPKAVPNLTPGGEYHYTIRVQETAAPDHGSNTNKAKTNTSSTAKATGNPPAPAFSTTAGANTHTGFTTGSIETATMGTAKKADGEAVNPDGSDVEYKLYYASSTATAPLTASQVKEAGLTASQTAGDKTGGIATATIGSPVVVTEKSFVGKVYMMLEAIIKTDTSKTALSDIVSYKVTGLAAAGTTGTAPSIAAKEGTTELGSIRITLSDPEDWGTRDNGTPVAKKDIVFWLFYLQDAAGTKDKAAITTAVGKAAVHNTADLAAPNQDKGVIQIASNVPSPFVLTGLKAGTQYAFFLRLIHPDAPSGTPPDAYADERTKDARDTAVVQGTSKLKAWYVSTIANTGFNTPESIAVAKDGTAYVTDTGNLLIKKIAIDEDGTATVSTIAGSTAGYNGDKTIGTEAQFNGAKDIALAPDDNTLYVVDMLNNRIRMITLTSPYAVSTIAGDGTAGYKDTGEGETGKDAQFNHPKGIALAPDGNVLYVADTANGRIRRIALGGDFPVSTVIKFPTYKPYTIAYATDALYFIGFDLYYAGGTRLRKIALKDNIVSTIAGNLRAYSRIAIAPNGTLYVTDATHSIKQITLKPDGSLKAISTIAGSGTAGNTNGIGTTAQFNHPKGIAAVSDTIFYVADTANNSIKKLEYKE